jgi:subtilisin family serine protease
MRCISSPAKKINKRVGTYIFALAFLSTLLFPPLMAGEAQEPTPTITTTVPILETATGTASAIPQSTTPATETEPAVPEEEASQQAQSSGATSRILVTISPRARIWTVMERVEGFGKATERVELSKLGVFIMEVPAEDLEERMKQIRNTTGVQYVEPEQWVSATDIIPNDPGFVNQYALNSIRAPQGWDYSTGSNSVTIAILDSGVDHGHVDLAGKITAGYDFVFNDAHPQDDNGHGTHVAGIAAASTNNNKGIAGVSWRARIMPLKVLNSAGNGSYENVASAIVWAVDNGAQVINLSLGGSGFSQVLENAVLYAYDNNVLIVASTGNTGSNFVLYPARFPQVVAVGASNMSDQPASFSNYGPEVDLAAPGENIYSLWLSGYQLRTGTSMSAPHVSGLASILFGYIISADAVRGIMEATAWTSVPLDGMITQARV